MIEEAGLCSFCRYRPSCGLLDDELVCFDCLEELVERSNAVAEFPDLRELLPAIRISEPVRLGRRPLTPQEQREGRLKLIALGFGWSGGGPRAWEEFLLAHPEVERTAALRPADPPAARERAGKPANGSRVLGPERATEEVEASTTTDTPGEALSLDFDAPSGAHFAATG